MSTVLLTWNPTKFDWYKQDKPTDRLPAMARRSRRGLPVKNIWSVARTKHVREGDRLFLLKQGAEPRGIFGSGYATSDWFRGRDWRPERGSREVHYVELEHDVLLDPKNDEILPVSSLTEGSLRHVHWATQFSGIRIRDDAARELERLWQDHLGHLRFRPTLARKHKGGGFGSFENNRAVEHAAVDHVTASLKKEGWTVRNVEARQCGFDLLCRRLNEELHVEVKGASGPEQRFIITTGEVSCAEGDSLFRLRVVTEACSPFPKMFSYSGQRFLKAFSLEPLQYKALPKQAAR
jgi:hypothetical protein